MNLTRPIISLDFETTGPNRATDRIVQYSFRIWQNGATNHVHSYLNPGMPISESATAVHGITIEHVEGAQKFEQVAHEILALISGCDLVGFGIRDFDIPMLFAEFQRAGVEWDYTQHHIIDTMVIYKRMFPRTLSAAFREYIGHDLEDAHDAGADTNAALQVFFAQLGRHAELPQDLAALALFSSFDQPRADLSGCFAFDAEGEVVLAFGKHKGQRAKANLGYLSWMLGQEFPADSKMVCRKVLQQGELSPFRHDFNIPQPQAGI
jgi:DNA polymerase-3 subunit epsilon